MRRRKKRKEEEKKRETVKNALALAGLFRTARQKCFVVHDRLSRRIHVRAASMHDSGPVFFFRTPFVWRSRVMVRCRRIKDDYSSEEGRLPGGRVWRDLETGGDQEEEGEKRA